MVIPLAREGFRVESESDKDVAVKWSMQVSEYVGQCITIKPATINEPIKGKNGNCIHVSIFKYYKRCLRAD